ncbi:MAG: alcohol dehydrogenase catalytic domain-containing protein [Atribacterota bacterium]|jgi:threonine dehydrogenase-like Zn-dependent dehydrogenase|uniref:zinc-dependent alcohol dehydrogenase n=1 Tax=Atribacter sp. TaxID=2847780 RepID=UPI00345E575E|nr:alcohol dehydrogenase catalytic domain-containing protein [Atribacterota bacterium]
MKRKVAKLISPKTFVIEQEEIPPLKKDEVLVKIETCGICHTEMSTYLGESVTIIEGLENYRFQKEIPYPVELGHEPSGIILDVGSEVKDLKIGDRVGGPVDGSFASHVVTIPKKLVKIPDSVENPEYCLAEPLGCISNMVRTARPEYGDFVAVIGCGTMGLLTLSALKQMPLQGLIAIDLQDSRLEWAKRLGAQFILNPKRDDCEQFIQDLTHNQGVDIAIEITGKLKGLEMASLIIRNASFYGYQGRGRIIASSFYAGDQIMSNTLGYQLMFKSPIVASVHPWHSLNFIEDVAKGVWGYQKHFLPLDQLVTHEFCLEDLAKGFEAASGKDIDYLKGVIIME